MAKRSPGSPSMPADRRVVVGLDGTRSYGIGLALVLQGAGLTVVEIERPRRGSGGGASRTRSMPTWLRCTRCAWPLTGCPHRALTVTVRRHGIRGRGLLGVPSPWPARGACSPRFTPRIDRLTTRLGDEISGGDPSPVHLYRNSFEPLYRHRRHCDDGPAGGMSSRVVLSEPGR
jgi:hypothetical protein